MLDKTDMFYQLREPRGWKIMAFRAMIPVVLMMLMITLILHATPYYVLLITGEANVIVRIL